MESILYMLLRLPYSLGGCGFSNIKLNIQISLVNGKYYVADFIDPKFKLILEYDSFMHHNNISSFSEDSIRAEKLEDLGYTVKSIKFSQISTANNFLTLAKNIARLRDKQLRIRCLNFPDANAKIHSLIKRSRIKINTELNPVDISEVPAFPGVAESYERYLESWKQSHPF